MPKTPLREHHVTAASWSSRVFKSLGLDRCSDLQAGRLVAIDALRGIAVLLVVVAHLPFSWSLTPFRAGDSPVSAAFSPIALAITGYGRFGVRLLWVFSGFACPMRWVRLPGESHVVDFFSFWRRRSLRLYPPYFVAILGSLAGLFVIFGILGRPSDLRVA